MTKLKDLDRDVLDTMINKRKFKLEKEYKWYFQDKRLKALLNEVERRVMEIK